MKQKLHFIILVTIFMSVGFTQQAAAIGLLIGPRQQMLQIESHRVDVTIHERGATTTVTQVFRNTQNRILEADYVFPLPKGASIDSFSLWMNGKKVSGSVKESQEAKRIYESIVRQQRDPALIEYIDSRLFRARVFPIPAKGTQKVELVYSQLVDYENGVHHYLYPLKTNRAASKTLKDMSLNVKVHSKLPISNFFSPTHKSQIKMSGKTARLSFEKNQMILNQNFELFWSVDDAEVGMTLLSSKEQGENGYFMLLASPNTQKQRQEIIGKDIVFVIDTSGSMDGNKMTETKKALKYCVEQLSADDTFNIISFGGFAENFKPKMIAASQSNKKKALSFVAKMEAFGGTNIDEAFGHTFKMLKQLRSKKHQPIIVFLTDGTPTVGETNVKSLKAKILKNNDNQARVFVFGVGTDVNTVLLDGLASENHGDVSYVQGDHHIESVLKSFYMHLSHPVLSNIAFKMSSGGVYAMQPSRVQDLFMGRQLVILGRYKQPGKTSISLSGVSGDVKQEFRFDGVLSAQSTEYKFIARLWAQKQVAALLNTIREEGQENPALVKEIKQLAIKFGIVTPYTSYLVIEDGMSIPPPGRPRPFPRPIPMLGRFGASDQRIIKKNKAGGKAVNKSIMMESEGDAAVAFAKDLKEMSDSEVVEEYMQQGQVQIASRVFKYIDGNYVDMSIGNNSQNLVVESYSRQYFEILKLNPKLKKVLVLGGNIRIRLAKGYVLLITTDPLKKQVQINSRWADKIRNFKL